MQQKRWNQIESILDTALTLTGDERTTYINEACGEDDELLREVYDILKAVQASERTGFLERASEENAALLQDLSGASFQSQEQLIGTRIAAFKITGQLGAGGMGAVYKAERADGQFSQQVAIKLLQSGIQSDETLRRFRMEQEILASLKHPNIAQLYDGGITENGLPYLIMEYVDGVPIDRYCNENRLTIDERINLFKDVCSAVQFAHANLVIHRDLKAQNIYVTSGGVVKVLDFGIAKLLDPKLTEQTLLQTRPGQKFWTPQYAAPEQVKGRTITTATDVYALGVLLHKLLTDTYPLNFNDKPIAEVERIIKETVPLSPSGSIQSEEASALRGASKNELQKKLSGDLDALVLKALRKEPEYRYNSVGQLIEEIERYEKGVPLVARKDTARYRVGKFYRRHKAGIGVTGIILLIISSLIGFYTWRIAQERDGAKLEAKKARQVTDYLKNIFQSSDPNQAQGETITAKQLLKAGIENISNTNEQPEAKAELLETLAGINYSLGYYTQADSLFKEALGISRNLYGELSPITATVLYKMALNKENMGQYDTTEVLLKQSLAVNTQIYDENNIQVIKNVNSLAYLHKLKGNLEEAESNISQGLFKLQSSTPVDSAELAEAYYLKASILTEKGEYKQAIDTQNKALKLANSLYTAPHPKIAKNLGNLARNHQKLGQFAEAESLYIESSRMDRALYDGEHLSIAVGMNNLAGVYKETNKLKKADSLYAQALIMLKNVLGKEHPYVASSLYNHANLKRKMGDHQEAKILYLQTIKLDTMLLGANHPNVASDYYALGLTLHDEGAYNDALKYSNKALNIQKNVYNNSHHPLLVDTKLSLATIYGKMGNLIKAEQLLREVFSARANILEYDNSIVTETAEKLKALLIKKGAFTEADSLMSVISSDRD